MVEVRKVLYHTVKGVFLGFTGDLVDASASDKKTVWGKDLGLTGQELAPTFLSHDEYINYLESNGVGIEDISAGVLMECWPSRGTLATADDVANCGLPRWGVK